MRYITGAACRPLKLTWRQGTCRVISFMPDVRTRYIHESELRAVDSHLRSFFNTNTPEEWAEAMRLLAGQ